MSLYHKENPEDWIGFKINNIEVLSKIDEKKYKCNSLKKDYFYISDILMVKCITCNTQRKCVAKSLIRNKSKGCRHCAKRKDAIGKQNGKLIVKNYEYKKSKTGRSVLYYVCDCSCGGNHVIKADIFNNGDSYCCPKCKKSSKFIPCKNINKRTVKKYLSNIKYRINKLQKLGKNIDFNLDEEFLAELLKRQNYICSMSGVSIFINDGTASLDRINNLKGYTKDNVQWIHRTINYMKNELNQQDFIHWCKLVSVNN